MTSNKGIRLIKIGNGIRFPGVFLIGIFSVASAFLLFSESTFFMTLWAASGFLLAMLGIELYFKPAFGSTVVGLIGFLYAIYALVLFGVLQYQSASIAVLVYVLGVVLLSWGIAKDVGRNFPQSWMPANAKKDAGVQPATFSVVANGQKMEDQIEARLETALGNLKDGYGMYQGNKEKYEMNLRQAKRNRLELLLQLLETTEFLENALKTHVGPEDEIVRRIEIKIYELRQNLETSGVMQMPAVPGEYVDEKNKHHIINSDECPKDWPARKVPRVKSVRKQGYTAGLDLLRRAEVEADWT
jgi:molecular chaperone GrpE (heat shock protein)